MNQDALIEQLSGKPGFMKAASAAAFAKALFVNYQAKVVFGDQVIGRFGYGSLGAARDVANFNDNRIQPYAITVGNYYESSQSHILLGGEHDNQLAINMTWNHMPLLQRRAAGQGIIHHGSSTRGAVKIGSNVTVSQSCIIVSGVTVGNGAVIGAGSVVTKDVPDFAIVAGSPARVLRYRFEEPVREALNKIRWWDLRQDSLLIYYQALQSIPDPKAMEELLAIESWQYRILSEDYLVFKAMTGPSGHLHFELAAIERNGVLTKLDEMPELIRDYFNQAHLPAGSKVCLVDNIFEAVGMAVV